MGLEVALHAVNSQPHTSINTSYLQRAVDLLRLPNVCVGVCLSLLPLLTWKEKRKKEKKNKTFARESKYLVLLEQYQEREDLHLQHVAGHIWYIIFFINTFSWAASSVSGCVLAHCQASSRSFWSHNINKMLKWHFYAFIFAAFYNKQNICCHWVSLLGWWSRFYLFIFPPHSHYLCFAQILVVQIWQRHQSNHLLWKREVYIPEYSVPMQDFPVVLVAVYNNVLCCDFFKDVLLFSVLHFWEKLTSGPTAWICCGSEVPLVFLLGVCDCTWTWQQRWTQQPLYLLTCFLLHSSD